MFPTLKVHFVIQLFFLSLNIDSGQMFGVGSIPWSPLGRGLLTRPLQDQKATKRAETDFFIEKIMGMSSNENIIIRCFAISSLA